MEPRTLQDIAAGRLLFHLGCPTWPLVAQHGSLRDMRDDEYECAVHIVRKWNRLE
jgi:hypothetical protein